MSYLSASTLPLKYQTADMYFSSRANFDTDKETLEFLNHWYDRVLSEMETVGFLDYNYDMVKKMFGYVWQYEGKFSTELTKLVDKLFSDCCERVDRIVLDM